MIVIYHNALLLLMTMMMIVAKQQLIILIVTRRPSCYYWYDHLLNISRVKEQIDSGPIQNDGGVWMHVLVTMAVHCVFH